MDMVLVSWTLSLYPWAWDPNCCKSYIAWLRDSDPISTLRLLGNPGTPMLLKGVACPPWTLHPPQPNFVVLFFYTSVNYPQGLKEIHLLAGC